MRRIYIQNSPGASTVKKHLKQYSFSYIVFGLAIVFVLIFEVIFSSTLQSYDLDIVQKIQYHIPYAYFNAQPYKSLNDIALYGMEFYYLNGFLCFLYCSFNPFIIFKITLVSNFAVFVHTALIILIYCEPRPYWTTSHLRTSHCQAVFAGPAYNQFMGTLLMLYFISTFGQYKVIVKPFPKALFIGILIIINGVTLVFTIFNAQNFIYQSILGVAMGIITFAIASALDDYISLLTLKAGFFAKSSKKYKFWLLVVLLAMFSFCLICMMAAESESLVMPEWLGNYDMVCKRKANDLADAYDNTKIRLSSIAVPLGMTFGASFSNGSLAADWWRTHPFTRLLRGIIALGIHIAIFVAFSLVPYSDPETEFTFHYFIPEALIHFVCYGFLPLLFHKIKLAQGESEQAPDLNISKEM